MTEALLCPQCGGMVNFQDSKCSYCGVNFNEQSTLISDEQQDAAVIDNEFITPTEKIIPVILAFLGFVYISVYIITNPNPLYAIAKVQAVFALLLGAAILLQSILSLTLSENWKNEPISLSMAATSLAVLLFAIYLRLAGGSLTNALYKIIKQVLETIIPVLG